MIKPYDIEIITRDDIYTIVDCVGYFIKDGIVVIEKADGGRALIKDFGGIEIPKEWKNEDKDEIQVS